MWSRRETIAGGMLTLLFGNCCAHAESSRAPHTFGCCLAKQDVDRVYPAGTDTRVFFSGNEPMIPRSGDRDFDYALAQTLAKISDAFGVLPGFAYYDDSGSLNAYATERTRLDRADGTVLMGINLQRQLRASRDNPDVAVVAVCAHEFGHIVQYRHRLIEKVNAGQPTVKRSELQADYFAGFYAGLRKKERPSYPAAVVAVTQGEFGGNNFSNHTHHGTETERANAVVRGFEAAFREGKSLNQAIEESTNYALTL
jgi:hypothetical protein